MFAEQLCHCLQTTDDSPFDNSFKANSRRNPLFHVMQYGNDDVGRELNLNANCQVGSGSRSHKLQTSWTKVDKD